MKLVDPNRMIVLTGGTLNNGGVYSGGLAAALAAAQASAAAAADSAADAAAIVDTITEGGFAVTLRDAGVVSYYDLPFSPASVVSVEVVVNGVVQMDDAYTRTGARVTFSEPIDTDWLPVRISCRVYLDADPLALDADGNIIPPNSDVGLGTAENPFGEIVAREVTRIAPPLAQRNACELYIGWNVSTPDQQLFDGGYMVAQGLAYLDTPDGQRLYMLQAVPVTGGVASDAPMRIVEFAYADDGSAITPLAWSPPLALGHHGLCAVMEGGAVVLYSQNSTAVTTGTGAGRGLSRIVWGGSDTTQADVTNIPLFGAVGSGHWLEAYYNATAAISADGKWLVAVADNTGADLGQYLFVWDWPAVRAAGSALAVKPSLQRLIAQPGVYEDARYVQGVTCDGARISVLRGFTPAFGRHVMQVFDMRGEVVDQYAMDGARAIYSDDDLLGGSALGVPRSFEPEGLTIGPDGQLLALYMDVWWAAGDVVEYEGRNYACQGTSLVGVPPDSSAYWVRTDLAADAGTWDRLTTYDRGAYTRVGKIVMSIAPPVGAVGETPLLTTVSNRGSGASIHCQANSVDMSYRWGDVWQLSAYAQNTERYMNALQYEYNRLRIYDTSAGADNASFGQIGVQFRERRYTYLRAAGGALAYGSGVNLYAADDPDAPGQIELWGNDKLALRYDPVADRTRARHIAAQVAGDAVAADATGTTSWVTLKSVTIPAGCMGANGWLRIRTLLSTTKNANAKAFRVSLGGSYLTDISTTALASQASHEREQVIYNRNSVTSQIASSDNASVLPGRSSDAFTTLSVDTSVDQVLLIEGQVSTTSDLVRLEAFIVEACYRP